MWLFPDPHFYEFELDRNSFSVIVAGSPGNWIQGDTRHASPSEPCNKHAQEDATQFGNQEYLMTLGAGTLQPVYEGG
jgi:hypothetical protein